MIWANNFTDFEENEILHAEYGSSKYIFKSNGESGYDEYLTNNKFKTKEGNKTFKWNNFIIRKATELEKVWLRECIKQNKFVPLENIKLPQNDWLWTV